MFLSFTRSAAGDDVVLVVSLRLVLPPQAARAKAVRATAGSRKLKTYPVEIRDGAIWLVG